MDWSSIYEEHGDEAGSWDEDHMNNRVTVAVDTFTSTRAYSPAICYMFTVNYVLGVGCLGIPYAFLQSGIALGTVIVICTSLIALLTVLWIAEAGHVFRYVLSYNPDLSQFKKILSGSGQNISEKTSLTETPPKKLRAMSLESVGSTGRNHIDDFEVTDLVSAFLGPYGSFSYQFALITLTFVGLIAYSQVFVITFLSQVYPASPIYVPVLIFGCIVIPLSCVDLADQILAQVTMSIMRFFTLGVLLVGLILAIFIDPVDCATAVPGDSPPFITDSVPLLHTGGIGIMMSTAIFSQLFQHSVPGLIRPLQYGDQKATPMIFSCALLTTGVLYICIGIASVLYFGSSVSQSINLNFVDFNWGLADNDYTSGKFYISTAFAMLIVVFPALDTLSVYPLIANTLGNNILAAFPKWRKLVKNIVILLHLDTLFPPVDKNFTYYGPLPVESKYHRATGIVGRFVAAVPPILCCLTVKKLSVTLQLAGVCGIVVALVTPALMQRQVSRFYEKFSIPTPETNNNTLESFYISKSFSSPLYTSIVLFTAVCAMIVCLSQLYYSLYP